MRIENMSEEDKKIIKRQRCLALLCPPEQVIKILEPYKNLKNYLDPTYIPDEVEDKE